MLSFLSICVSPDSFLVLFIGWDAVHYSFMGEGNRLAEYGSYKTLHYNVVCRFQGLFQHIASGGANR